MSTMTQKCVNCGANGEPAVVTLSKPIIVVPLPATATTFTITPSSISNATVSYTPQLLPTGASSRVVMEGFYVAAVVGLTIAVGASSSFW